MLYLGYIPARNTSHEMPRNAKTEELMRGTKTADQQPEEMVLEIFRILGGEANIDQVVESSAIKYRDVVTVLRQLCKRGAVVRGFYETRYALPA